MTSLELFLQGEGIPQITLVTVPSEGVVGEIIEVARTNGLRSSGAETAVVFLEDEDEALTSDKLLELAGIHNRSRVHVHHRQKIEVTVAFNGRTESHPFSPSTRVGRVKELADAKFGIAGMDATEHALQVAGSSERPSEDRHIGSLLLPGEDELHFDLVPKERVEG